MSKPRKQWIISQITEEDAIDAARIGRIAFHNSTISNYLRPPRLRDRSLSEAETDARGSTLMKARIGHGTVKATDPGTGRVVGYAVWKPAYVAGDAYNPLPPENERDIQTDWTAQQIFRTSLGKHGAAIMSDRPHWYLIALATHKDYERQGVAAALVRWGLDQAKGAGMPALVESVPSAVPVYEKAGFKHVNEFTLDFPEEAEDGHQTGKTATIVLKVMIVEN